MRDFAYQIVYFAIFWGVQEITDSHDTPTNFDAKYIQTYGSGQGYAFWDHTTKI